MRGRWRWIASAAPLLVAATSAGAEIAAEAYKTMGIRPGDVLNGTVLAARVRPGDPKQVVALVTYLTGARDEARAVNVRLEVWAEHAEKLTSLYARDYAKENGGHVGRGELELLDFDGDGVSEIVVTYEDAREPLVKARRGEVFLWDASGFRLVWADLLEYDATRAVRDIPSARRDRYTREIDIVETRRTKGESLVVRKKVFVVAGEKLSEPRVLQEAFPLRP